MELERIPAAGDFYRHFKGGVYQVLTLASLESDGTALVIYQALYGKCSVYARPLSEFVSLIDKKKYPGVEATYRFEKIRRDELPGALERLAAGNAGVKPAAASLNNEEESERKEQTDSKPAWKSAPIPSADSDLMRFLDAETTDEKYEVLSEIESRITEKVMNSIEVSMDIVGVEGSLSDRIDYVKKQLRTQSRFDTTRLR